MLVVIIHENIYFQKVFDDRIRDIVPFKAL